METIDRKQHIHSGLQNHLRSDIYLMYHDVNTTNYMQRRMKELDLTKNTKYHKKNRSVRYKIYNSPYALYLLSALSDSIMHVIMILWPAPEFKTRVIHYNMWYSATSWLRVIQ
jgi:hypothetical protein